MIAGFLTPSFYAFSSVPTDYYERGESRSEFKDPFKERQGYSSRAAAEQEADEESGLRAGTPPPGTPIGGAPVGDAFGLLFGLTLMYAIWTKYINDKLKLKIIEYCLHFKKLNK
jgi:hypothetical protein